MERMERKINRIKQDLASLEEMMSRMKAEYSPKGPSEKPGKEMKEDTGKKVIEPEYIPPSSDDDKEADSWFGEMLIK